MNRTAERRRRDLAARQRATKTDVRLTLELLSPADKPSSRKTGAKRAWTSTSDQGAGEVR